MSAYERMLALYADVSALRAAQSLMSWDQQVLMPPGGAPARAAHSQRLRRLMHERLTGDALLRATEDAASEVDPQSEEGRCVAALKRELDIETKLPLDLVQRKARLSSEAYDQWKISKHNNDFASMAPFYGAVFEIARESAEALGYLDHPYDALIGLYEYGSSFADADRMFQGIKSPIVRLVQQIRDDGRPVDDSALCGEFDPERLRAFAERTATVVGFDFSRGRLNVCQNAFCSGVGSTDVRMTTRPNEHVKGIVSSSLHEMGHGLYEQGSPRRWNGTPLGGGISLAVHESQSRLWENVVGRSRGFWRRFLPDLQAAFPRLSSLDVEGMYRGINKVEPSLIRVGADELTYNLHILIRFELEVELVTGQLRIEDLPDAWNTKYEAYLGLTPPSDTLGCLQDVHWSRGSVGYFPTYAMGNLIGLQIWQRLRVDVPDPEALMAAGNFEPILAWLTEKIYSQAKLFEPRDLVIQVTGKPMEPTAWLDYAEAKYREIYGL